MPQDIKIREYLETVCHQIRCKKFHAEISEELENHITDQKDAFKAQGIDDDDATLRAIEQMGDPIIVGTELDRTHKPKPEWSIIALTFLLLAAGTIIRFFTPQQAVNGLDLFYRQLIFTIVGLGFMTLCYYIDFTFIGKHPKSIFWALFTLTILITAITSPIRGILVYTSYLLLLFPTALAGIAYSMRNKGYLGIIYYELFFALPFAISIMLPSLTISILLGLSSLLTLTIAIFKNWFGVNKRYAILLVYLPATAVLFAASINNTLWQRVAIAFSPSLDPTGQGYIGIITRELLAGAKFIGQGTLPERFQGLSATQVLPSINNDFLLTYIIYRFGWLAFIIIAALLTTFIIRAFILCSKQKSVLALLVSTAATITITMQALFYVVANLGFELFRPLSLPLISQGGSYLLINMCLVGILLSVFRTGYFIKDTRDSKKTTTSSIFKIVEGKLIIDFKLH